MKKIILSFVAAFGLLSLNAQVTGYHMVPCTGTGNPGGLNVDPEYPPAGGGATGWTTLLTGPQTNAWTGNQTIPFAFYFNGEAVTQYKVSSTGIITFDVASTAAAPSATPSSLPSASIPDKSVVVWGAEIKTAGDYILTKTFGTNGKRQHFIQFTSATEANIQSGWVYFSVVLEEGTNNIYLVDQRWYCSTGSAQCSGTTKLTVGYQIDATSGNGMSNYEMKSGNDPASVDNVYYTISPGTLADNNADAVSLALDEYMLISGAPFSLNFDVKNLGGKAITSMKLGYAVDGGTEVVEDFTGLDIAACATKTMTFNTKWNPANLGKYTVVARVIEVNGSADALGTNSISKTVTVVDKVAQRKILHEIFTSSTCPPCNSGNINFNNVISGKSNHSTIKYQVNWPGTGDPYCTQEVRNRVAFYGANSAPLIEVDGGWGGNAGSYSKALYDEFAAKPAFLEISGTATNTWKNTITADITLNPLVDFASSNLKLFAVITEGTTFANKKTNGETQFEDVMKKMMPNSTGFGLTGLTRGTAVNQKLSFAFQGNYRLSLDGTTAQHINHTSENSVETWDDMHVVVFVQDAVTKEVLQSETFAIALASVESVESGVLVYPNPSNNAFEIKASDLANVSSEVVITNIQGQVVMSTTMNNGSLQVNTADWSEGMYMVSVKSATSTLNTKLVVKH